MIAIDGRKAFKYRVDMNEFLKRLAARHESRRSGHRRASRRCRTDLRRHADPHGRDGLPHRRARPDRRRHGHARHARAARRGIAKCAGRHMLLALARQPALSRRAPGKHDQRAHDAGGEDPRAEAARGDPALLAGAPSRPLPRQRNGLRGLLPGRAARSSTSTPSRTARQRSSTPASTPT